MSKVSLAQADMGLVCPGGRGRPCLPSLGDCQELRDAAESQSQKLIDIPDEMEKLRRSVREEVKDALKFIGIHVRDEPGMMGLLG